MSNWAHVHHDGTVHTHPIGHECHESESPISALERLCEAILDNRVTLYPRTFEQGPYIAKGFEILVRKKAASD